MIDLKALRAMAPEERAAYIQNVLTLADFEFLLDGYEDIARLHKLQLDRTGATQDRPVDQIYGDALDMVEQAKRHHDEHHAKELDWQKRYRTLYEEVVDLRKAQTERHDWQTRAVSLAERLTVVEQERDKAKRDLRGATMCDACCGTGTALSGPCGCGGTGQLAAMLAHVRGVLFKTEMQRDEARDVIAAARAMREHDRKKPRGPGRRHAEEMEWEGGRDQYVSQLFSALDAMEDAVPPREEAIVGRTVEDGFGGCAYKCEREDCELQVVRPGKFQCTREGCDR